MSPKETELDQIIREATRRTTAEHMRFAAEQIAAQLAQEILADPDFRHAMKTLAQKYARETLEHLTASSPTRRQKGKTP